MKVNIVELPGDGYNTSKQWFSPNNPPAIRAADYSMRAAVYYRI